MAARFLAECQDQYILQTRHSKLCEFSILTLLVDLVILVNLVILLILVNLVIQANLILVKKLQ